MSTDWASSSRLWPVASFVAPARSCSHDQRLLPQDPADAAGLRFPAFQEGIKGIAEEFPKGDGDVLNPESSDKSLQRSGRLLRGIR